ncbi:MAG: hypothetical protein EOP06_07670 [Proteobacteria bacterium]|nr:MAG: hypothetical protein EOP06_07670 [Pseudomonadota bacterium]
MNVFSRFVSRISAFKRIELLNAHAGVQFSRSTEFRTKATSKILVVDGTLTVGYPLAAQKAFATADRTVITLGANSTIKVLGDVIIAPGATIRVEDGAELILGGSNIFAHNLTIICGKKMVFGKGAEISWNVTFIDDDGHTMENKAGRALRILYRPMIIGENVGIQMNSIFPRGVSVGANSIIASGTVVRRDIPENCLALSDAPLKIKHGIRKPSSKTSAGRENL